MQHMSKCFQAIDKLKLDQVEAQPGGPRPKGLGMVSSIGEEYVPFKSPLALEGKVGGVVVRPGRFCIAATFACEHSCRVAVCMCLVLERTQQPGGMHMHAHTTLAPGRVLHE